jgi:hypothetical protein
MDNDNDPMVRRETKMITLGYKPLMIYWCYSCYTRLFIYIDVVFKVLMLFQSYYMLV